MIVADIILSETQFEWIQEMYNLNGYIICPFQDRRNRGNPSLTDIIMINKHPFKLLEKTTLEDYLLHIPEHIPPPTNFSKSIKVL